MGESTELCSKEFNIRSDQYPEKLEAQLLSLKSLFDETQAERMGQSALSSELRRQFGGGIKGFEMFVSEVERKSTAGVFVFDLLRMADFYEAPEVSFSTHKVERNGLETSLKAYFIEGLDVTFHSAFNQVKPEVCTKNKSVHSLASYQDAADPFTHYLRVTSRNQGQEHTSLLEATLIECVKEGEKKGKEDVLLVEGIFGKIEEGEKGILFDYLYSCLIKFAHKKGSEMTFNLHFNPASQVEPIEFVNYVGSRVANVEFYQRKSHSQYRRINEEVQKHSTQLRALRVGDASVKEQSDALTDKLSGFFAHPQNVLSNFASDDRYSDTWWQSEGKSEWNRRDGQVYGLELNVRDIRREYNRLFSSARRTKVGGFLGATALLIGLVGYVLSMDRPIRCENGEMESRFSFQCSTEEGTQKLHFYDLDTLIINTPPEEDFLVATVGSKENIYLIEMKGKDNVLRFRRSAELQPTINQATQGKDLCTKNTSMNEQSIIETIGSCTGSSQVVMRALELFEKYGDLHHLVMPKILYRISDKAYQTKNSHEMLSFIEFLNDDQVVEALKLPEMLFRHKLQMGGANDFVDKVFDLVDVKNPEIVNGAMVWFHNHTEGQRASVGGRALILSVNELRDFMSNSLLERFVRFANNLAVQEEAPKIVSTIGAIVKEAYSVYSDHPKKVIPTGLNSPKAVVDVYFPAILSALEAQANTDDIYATVMGMSDLARFRRDALNYDWRGDKQWIMDVAFFAYAMHHDCIQGKVKQLRPRLTRRHSSRDVETFFEERDPYIRYVHQTLAAAKDQLFGRIGEQRISMKQPYRTLGRPPYDEAESGQWQLLTEDLFLSMFDQEIHRLRSIKRETTEVFQTKNSDFPYEAGLCERP